MKRQRLLLLLPAAALIGLLLWLALRDPQGQARVLADGSKIIFLGVTVGTNHSRSYGSVWQRMIARLPGSLRDKFADTTLIQASHSGQTNVAFWFRVQKNPALKEFVHIQPTTNGGARALFRFRFKDELGQNLTNPGYILRHQLPSADYAYVAWATNFPSTSREVHLWLSRLPLPQEEREPADEFRTPNPMYRDKP